MFSFNRLRAWRKWQTPGSMQKMITAPIAGTSANMAYIRPLMDMNVCQ